MPDIVVVVIVRPRGTQPVIRLGAQLIGGQLVEEGGHLASFIVHAQSIYL